MSMRCKEDMKAILRKQFEKCFYCAELYHITRQCWRAQNQYPKRSHKESYRN